MFINMYTINLYDSILIIGRYRTQGIMTIGSLFKVPQSIIVGPVVWLQSSYSSVWWIPAMENFWVKTGETSNGLSALNIAELHLSMLISLVNTCFSYFSTAVIKPHDRKHLRRRNLFQFLFLSNSLSLRSQGRHSRQELIQRPWRNTAYRFALLPCSNCFLTRSRTTFSRLAPLPMSWVHPRHSLIKKILHSLATG